MGRVIKLTTAEFAEKVKALEIGEHFDFAAGTFGCVDPQDKVDLAEWYGIQKLSLFDSEIIIIAEYGVSGCAAFPADGDLLEENVAAIFKDLCETDIVYFVDEAGEEREPTVSLTESFCIDIRDCTNCGENVFIHAKKAHELANEIDKYNVGMDVRDKMKELGKAFDFTPGEISRMAETVIDRRDDCGIISDAYWQIVEEVIDDFSNEKSGGCNGK